MPALCRWAIADPHVLLEKGAHLIACAARALLMNMFTCKQNRGKDCNAAKACAS
jgi:hypothetical protein